MARSVSLLVLMAVMAVPLGAWQRAGTAVRTVFVTAVDDRGAPITDLTAADFRVRENGRDRPVLNAAVTQAPLVVVLILGDRSPWSRLGKFPEAAAAFATRLDGRAEVAVTTTGSRDVARLDFTRDVDLVKTAIDDIYDGIYDRMVLRTTGSFLIDGIVAAARVLDERRAARPVIILIGATDDDVSRARPRAMLDTLQRTRTQLYIVRGTSPSNGSVTERPQQRFTAQSRRIESPSSRSPFSVASNPSVQAFLDRAPARTGGRLQLPGALDAIQALEAIATELLSQYGVSYESPEAAETDLRLDVSTTRLGVRLRAPDRVGSPQG